MAAVTDFDFVYLVMFSDSMKVLLESRLEKKSNKRRTDAHDPTVIGSSVDGR